MSSISSRLREAVDALPLHPGMRVLELGCGPGAMLREIARRVAPGLGILYLDGGRPLRTVTFPD